jgi:hypothetical protein
MAGLGRGKGLEAAESSETSKTTGFRPSTGHQNKGGIENYQITCESGAGCWVRGLNNIVPVGATGKVCL